jgi:hypothetical protein
MLLYTRSTCKEWVLHGCPFQGILSCENGISALSSLWEAGEPLYRGESGHFVPVGHHVVSESVSSLRKRV